MQVFDFDVTSNLYNVVIVWNTPCGGEPKRDSKVANADPLEWPTAAKWCRDILHGIGRDWSESKYCDIYIEPVTIPRPWTPELFAMFRRELRRQHVEEPTERGAIDQRDNAYLKAQTAATHRLMGWPTVDEDTRDYVRQQAGAFVSI